MHRQILAAVASAVMTLASSASHAQHSPASLRDTCLATARAAHDQRVADCARSARRPDQIQTCRTRSDNTRLSAERRCNATFDQTVRRLEQQQRDAERRGAARGQRS